LLSSMHLGVFKTVADLEVSASASHPNQRKEKAAAKTAARGRIDARMCRPLDTNLDFSDEEARVGWRASVPQIRS